MEFQHEPAKDRDPDTSHSGQLDDLPDLSVSFAAGRLLERIDIVARLRIQTLDDNCGLSDELERQIFLRLRNRRPIAYCLDRVLTVQYNVSSEDDDDWSMALDLALGTAMVLGVPETARVDVELKPGRGAV